MLEHEGLAELTIRTCRARAQRGGAIEVDVRETERILLARAAEDRTGEQRDAGVRENAVHHRLAVRDAHLPARERGGERACIGQQIEPALGIVDAQSAGTQRGGTPPAQSAEYAA